MDQSNHAYSCNEITMIFTVLVRSQFLTVVTAASANAFKKQLNTINLQKFLIVG